MIIKHEVLVKKEEKIMKKRIVAVITALMMFATILSGCGASEDVKSDNSTEEKTSTSTSTKKEDDKASEQIRKLVIAYPKKASTASYETLPYFQKIEEMTGIEVEWIGWPEENAKEKMQLAFASGELPDLIINVLQPDDVVTFAEQGLIVAIDDKLESAPNLTKIFNDRPDFKSNATLPDGHIYSMPRLVEDHVNSNHTFMVNMEWLEMAGQEVPTTLDEFYECLKAVKEIDYNGNGKNDEIPWTFNLKTRHITGLQGFLSAFGVNTVDTCGVHFEHDERQEYKQH